MRRKQQGLGKRTIPRWSCTDAHGGRLWKYWLRRRLLLLGVETGLLETIVRHFLVLRWIGGTRAWIENVGAREIDGEIEMIENIDYPLLQDVNLATIEVVNSRHATTFTHSHISYHLHNLIHASLP